MVRLVGRQSQDCMAGIVGTGAGLFRDTRATSSVV